MRIEQYFDLLVDGYTPADIVKNLDLSEDDVMDMTIETKKWLDELQREANIRDSYQRYK
ncbi:hypothetical protein [Colwellia sp. BRX10-4]|jgi:hypothetical protein|uniref:hypothetical protein n=1 Tax=Colwellia sp. BRX10-4 TaxID=2759843 RepID=UPI0015F66705|nr:hypothetical protein [Colwellia sp. BRX10-4]MBA6398251.1 hypothetical protein [Colwellia sp. BRX10-4]